MKVFLSWSGDLSRQVANAFREWIPTMIQSAEPYLSAEDIEKGARWNTDIAQELEQSDYGIIIITKNNMHSQWINFEAGALSKLINKSYVTPFLFDMKNSELQGPLTQFQSTLNDKEDLRKLVRTMNLRMPEGTRLKEQQLDKTFTVMYPYLNDELQKIEKSHIPSQDGEKKPHKNQTEILEEIVDLVRTQQRIANTQSDILTERIYASSIKLQSVVMGAVNQLDSTMRSYARDRLPNLIGRDTDSLHERIITFERIVNSTQVDGKIDAAIVSEQLSRLHNEIHNLVSSANDRVRRMRNDGSPSIESDTGVPLKASWKSHDPAD